MKVCKLLFCLFLTSILASACSSKTPAEMRDEYAEEDHPNVILGAVWPHDTRWRTMGNAIDMAVDEVNSKGGVLGKKLVVLKKDDAASLNQGMIIAHEFANDPGVTGVIGHINSYISIPAASIYEFAKLPMITPGSNATKLTQNEHKYIFRALPNNRQIGKGLAEYAAKQGYKNIAIYYVNNSYGRDVANNFEKNAFDLNIEVIARRSFHAQNDDYAELLENWHEILKLDALVVVGSLPTTGNIVKLAREIGFKQPIIGDLAMNDQILINIAGDSAEGIVVPGVFVDKQQRPETLKFFADYKQRYGTTANEPAALAYDALMLMVTAIESAGSTKPEDVIQAMRNIKQHRGVTRDFSFDEYGDVLSQQIQLEQVKDGEFIVLD